VLCAIAAATGLQAFVEQAVLFREQPGVVASAAITAVRYLLLAWLVAVLIGGIGNAVMHRFASGKGSQLSLFADSDRVFAAACAAIAAVCAKESNG
jgi:hypothetical protein